MMRGIKIMSEALLATVCCQVEIADEHEVGGQAELEACLPLSHERLGRSVARAAAGLRPRRARVCRR